MASVAPAVGSSAIVPGPGVTMSLGRPVDPDVAMDRAGSGTRLRQGVVVP